MMLRPRTSFGLASALTALALLGCRDAPVADQVSSPDGGAVAVDAQAAAGSSIATPTSAKSTGSTADALPAIRGAKPGDVDMVSWFGAHQVDRAQLVAFLGSHGGSKVEATRCQAASVGAPAEPALVCLDQRIDEPHEQTRDHLQILVVRSGAPAIVAGLFTSYASWTEPTIRFVDLAVTLAPDGLSFTLDDRGPPGSRIMLTAPGALDPKSAEVVGCDQAREKAIGAETEISKGVAKLCAERGRWTWSANGHFLRPSHAKN